MRRLALPAAVLLAAARSLAVAGHARGRHARRTSHRGCCRFRRCIASRSSPGLAVAVSPRAGASLAPVWLLGAHRAAVAAGARCRRRFSSGPDRFAGSSGSAVGACSLVAQVMRRRRGSLVAGRGRAAAARRPPVSPASLAFAIFASSAWFVSPSVPGGDEPHYLVITQSLLLDGDLKIENNHRRGDYQSYFAGPLAPHYIPRGTERRDLLDSRARAVGDRGAGVRRRRLPRRRALPADRSRRAAARSRGTSRGSRRGSASAAWFGWAAVTMSATAIFHSFTVYPDGARRRDRADRRVGAAPRGAERQTGEARLRPWLLHGAALALLPWLHSRFALLAGQLGALVLLRLVADEEPGGEGRRVSLGARRQRGVLDRIVSSRSMAWPIRRRRTGRRATSRSRSFPAGSPGCCSISGSD